MDFARVYVGYIYRSGMLPDNRYLQVNRTTTTRYYARTKIK